MTKFKHEIMHQVRQFISRADDVTVWQSLQETKAKLAKAKTPKHKARAVTCLAMWVAEAKRRGITGPVNGIVTDEKTGISYRN